MKTATPRETYPTQIILEIQGLQANPDGTFTLEGIKPVDVNLLPVMENLMDQGIARTLAEVLIDRAYDTIQHGLLAEAIAQRTKRVG